MLRLRYSFTYKIIDCATFGVASKRKRFIILCARRGFTLPEWPEPLITDNGAFVTVQDVIQDLGPSRNKTTDAMGVIRCEHQQRDEYSSHTKALWDQSEVTESSDGTKDYWVYNHVTGRTVGKDWRAAKPNLPLQTVRTSLHDGWSCKHWGAS